MSERGGAAGRPARQPLPRRNRRRWLAAAGVAACWAILLDQTGSVIAATMLLALLAALTVVTVVALRALGVTRDHPWVQQLAARPWRDGQDVLRLALRHLPEVFVVTPSGSLIAPNIVDLRMNPADLDALREHMEIGLVAQSAAEVYVEQVAAHGARLGGYGPAEVHVIADPLVPAGRYRLRQGQPLNAGVQVPSPQLVPAGAPYQGFVGHDGNTRSHAGPAPAPAPVPVPAAWPEPAPPGPGLPTLTGEPTVIELRRSPVPALRLVTGDAVAETRVSGARAGRGPVELRLPEVPTVSREHARFTFSDGQWWISNLGRNGVTLNGAALVGEQPLGDGDSIRWGMRSDALLSKVQIG
jgi:FHA domain